MQSCSFNRFTSNDSNEIYVLSQGPVKLAQFQSSSTKLQVHSEADYVSMQDVDITANSQSTADQ